MRKSCKCSKSLTGCTVRCKCKGRCASNAQGNDKLFFKVFRNIVLRRQIIDPDGKIREGIRRQEELQKIKEARRDAIIKELSKYNLTLRPDSKLCHGYIDGTLENAIYDPPNSNGNISYNINETHADERIWTIDSIVQEMCIMKYLYEYCNLVEYWERVKSSIFDENYVGIEYQFVYRNEKRNILATAKRYCIIDHPLPLNRNYPWLKRAPSIFNSSLLTPTLNKNTTTITTTPTTTSVNQI